MPKHALTVVKKSLPPDHPHLAVDRKNHAYLLHELGRSEGASALRDQAEAIRRRREQPLRLSP